VVDQFKILAQMYVRPARALNATLDGGSFVFAAGCSIAVSLPFGAAAQLIPLAALLVPAAIAIIAAWDGLGSTRAALSRDYSPLLVCMLMCWTAAHLPFAAFALAAPAALDGVAAAQAVAVARLAALAYFLILSVLAVRTVTGATLSHALGSALGGVAAAGLGLWAYRAWGQFLYVFASPFLLLWLYLIFRPNLSLEFLAGGLRSRQKFRRHLEASTLNPRDADAHYQLGLIYQQRRNYAEAIARFQKAAEIDPSEADPLYQLGRIAREQGRHQDALRYFEAAYAIDPKHSSSEILRELGAAQLELGRADLALPLLEAYAERREYDPEGQYWLGQAYKRLNREAEARVAFEKSLEAARTAPPHLRRQAARWIKMARAQLR
jgi:tetratricopeptide (TPR) repeat protein